MGRINLSALRVRQQATQKHINLLDRKNRPLSVIPNWVDIVAEVPPAQILVRQQPHQHAQVQLRTKTIPGTNRTQQHVLTAPARTSKSRKASRTFVPVEIKYEEDDLRRTFFSDHPWELARPRIVLETDGNQYKTADWSKGLKQPNIPLSGESVIQRQLWLLENTPDITIPEAYDVARQEFYMLRRAEETNRRIAIEEAEHSGAVFATTAIRKSLAIENRMYDDWEKWSREQTMERASRSSAYAGESMPAEQDAVRDVDEMEEEQGGGPESGGNAGRMARPMTPNSPFAAEKQRRSAYNMA